MSNSGAASAAGGASPLVFDGLQISNFSRANLERIRASGITGINATCAVWEDPTETLRAIGQWYQLLLECPDVAILATSVEEIRQAKEDGRVAVVLGFQNSSSFGDDYRLVEVFYRLGVRIAQLTYNNQNALGGACYEPEDSGLTRFGKNIIAEMNRVGMLVDLSHVGNRTSQEAAENSAQPVAITHANPTWYVDVPRNKPQSVIDAVCSRGGMIGACLYPLVIGGKEAILADFVDMVVRLAEQVGPEHVGLGSDCTEDWDISFLHWLRDGRWRRPDPGELQWPAWPTWFSGPEDFPRLADALDKAGFSESELRGILGENWLRLFSTVFRPTTPPAAPASASPAH